jgi:Spy/CpxP family protein refolding chaperone
MTVASMDARPARRTPRWLIAVLAVSLLLNGLVLGAMGARLWSAQHAHQQWQGNSDNTHLFGLAVTLPPERYREIRLQVENERAAMRPLRQKRWDAREEVRKALVANPFEPAIFEQSQQRLFEAEQETRRGTLKVVAAIMARLTAEERAALAEWESQDRTKRREFWRRLRETEKPPGK